MVAQFVGRRVGAPPLVGVPRDEASRAERDEAEKRDDADKARGPKIEERDAQRQDERERRELARRRIDPVQNGRQGSQIAVSSFR